MQNRSALLLTTLFFLFISLSSNGQNFIWLKQVKRPSVGTCGAVMDNRGNSYLAGNFADSATFDTTTIFGTGSIFVGSGNIFLAKYDPAGNFINVIKNTGSGDTHVFDICSDHSNHIYIMVEFEGDVTIGTTSVHGDLGIFSYFIAKCDTSGNILWVKTFNNIFTSGDYDIRLCSISCNNDDSVYLNGYSDGSYTLDGIPINRSAGKVFIAKLNPADGTAIWAKQIQANYACIIEPAKIINDEVNNVIVCGTFGNDMCIFNGTDTLLNRGHINCTFISKYDNDGNFLWARQIDSSSSNECSGVSTDENQTFISLVVIIIPNITNSVRKFGFIRCYFTLIELLRTDSATILKLCFLVLLIIWATR